MTLRRFALAAAGLAVGVLSLAIAPVEADNGEPNGDDEAKLYQCLDAVRKANSDARACIGVVADPCLEQPSDSGPEGLIACIDRETVLWEQMLTDRFANLVAQVDDEPADEVRAVHEAWQHYRDKRCRLGESLFPEQAMADVWGADCLLQETGRRAIEISALIDELNGE